LQAAIRVVVLRYLMVVGDRNGNAVDSPQSYPPIISSPVS